MAEGVQVVRAQPSEAATLARLLQLYLHDFSEFAPLESPHGELADDGLFAYPHLASYWSELRHEPLLVRVSGRLAGFVLVNDRSVSGRPVDFVIAEFFIARKYRRRGIGTEAARQVIGARPGLWEVAVLAVNQPALAFWRRALPRIHSGKLDLVESHGEGWGARSFASARVRLPNRQIERRAALASLRVAGR